MDKFKKLKSILGKDLKEHIVLRDYTTMKVGGVADYFYVAKTIDGLIQAIAAARDLGISYEVLGGASNILVSDFGFGGLVILNRSSNLVFLPEQAQVIVDSGVSLTRLIMESANRSLAGLEPLYGIPGTVGGAIYGNAGAYGIEITQFLKSITVLSSAGKIVRYSAEWLEADYRSTRLKKFKKQDREAPVILSARFQLSHNKKEEILRKLAYYKKIREEKQPHGQPSAGSIFKNPSPRHPTSLKPRGTKDFAGQVRPQEMTAGYILDKLGAKRFKVGDAFVSNKHANFIINRGRARASDIRALIDILRDKAREEKGVILKEEIEYIGQW